MPIGSKRISFSVPFNWIISVPIVGIALIVGFVFVPDPTTWRPVLVFGAAVVAGSAALITAINNVDQRAAAALKSEEQAQAQRVIAALEMCARWNDSTFFHCKKSGREIRDKFKETPEMQERKVYLKSDLSRYTNLIDMFNSFEAMSIAIEAKVIDEPTAKRFFRSIVLEYWHIFDDFIKSLRAEGNNPRLYREFESLYSKWKD